MPDTKKYKSVAVPIPVWEKLWAMSEKNHRSPAQQISFLVEVAAGSPSDKEILSLYANIREVVAHPR
jgi:hypothetical protein